MKKLVHGNAGRNMAGRRRPLAAALLTVSLWTAPPVRAQETTAAPAPAPAPASAVVATVNGTALTEAEFLRLCERHVGGATDTAVGWEALKSWIQHRLAEEDARKRALLPTTADIDRRLGALRKQWAFRGEDFDTWLTGHGRTLETVRADIRQQLIAENLLTEGVRVTDAEATLYYADHKQAFGVPEQLKVSRITVRDRDAARKVEAALKKGTAFDVVAREQSQDRHALAGGLVLEPVDTDPRVPGPLEREVLERALKLQPEKHAGPIKVEDYWVFVRLEERIPARAPLLTDIQDLLVANLKVQKGGPQRLQEAQSRLIQLQKEAKIEIHRPEYRSLLKLLQPAPQ